MEIDIKAIVGRLDLPGHFKKHPVIHYRDHVDSRRLYALLRNNLTYAELLAMHGHFHTGDTGGFQPTDENELAAVKYQLTRISCEVENAIDRAWIEKEIKIPALDALEDQSASVGIILNELNERCRKHREKSPDRFDKLNTIVLKLRRENDKLRRGETL